MKLKLGATKRPPWLGPRFDIDFSERRTRPPPLAWAVLALGVLALTGATATLLPRLTERHQLLAERAGLLQRTDQQSGVAASRGPSAADLMQARALLDELGRPWKPLFDRFESVDVAKVYLVQLSVDSHFQGAQMIAEAARLEDVLQYSKKLQGDGTVRSVRLTHHEWRNVPGARVIIANLTADLAGADGSAAGESQ